MRIGTRRSALALAQARLVAELLREAGQGEWEIVPFTTSGDRHAHPPAPHADKSRWVAELEDALLGGEIDLAVHSAKDLPGELAAGLALHGAPERASVEDVLCGAGSLDDLPPGARIGTSSIRRMSQLRAAREDLDVVAMRGNVDTRLGKLAGAAEGIGAIVLARAGLQRLGREAEIGGVLDPLRFVPSPGQGTLALQGRAGDAATGTAAEAITDPASFACLLSERAVARELEASCHTPFGAWASAEGDGALRLRAWVGLPDGSAWASDELLGERTAPRELGLQVAERLRAAGAGDLLARAEGTAGVDRA